MTRAAATHSTIKRFFSCSSISACVKGREDQVLEPWKNSSGSILESWKSGSNNNEDCLSQASDSSHPLIQGISKLLQTHPGNPKFATADVEKLHLKINDPAALTDQRLRKKRWRQAVDMKPRQYLYLMSQWIRNGGAVIGQPMFQQMLKVGVEPVDAYSTMIHHFVNRAREIKCSLDVEEDCREEEAGKCILEGLKYLHDMRSKGVTPNGNSYEPLITWFLENGKSSEFEEILEWIKDNGLSCYNGLFKSFGRLGRYSEAERYFTKVKEMGVSEDLMSDYLCSFVQGIAAKGKFDEALTQFKKVTTKFKVTPAFAVYSTLINLSCKTNQIHQALNLIEEMNERGVQLSCEAFQPLMITFLQGSHPDGVFELFAAMQRMNVQPTSEAYNCLIRASAKSNNVDRMVKALSEMKELRLPRTSETYNAVIQALGAARKYAQAFSVLNDMQNDGVRPDAGTMLELINYSPHSAKALEVFEKLKSAGVKPTDAVYATLFNSLTKDGELDKALEMLKNPEANFRIGVISKSSLLEGLAEENRLDEALSCYEDILSSGKIPDAYAICSLVRALGIAGKLDRMFDLVDKHYMDRHFKKSERPSNENKIRLLMAATKACVIHNDLGRLETFLKKMEDFDPSIIFDSIILDIANGEDKTSASCWSWQNAFALHDIMPKLKISPSRTFLEALLDGCVEVKDADRADAIMVEMEANGLPLNGFSLVRLLRVYVVAEKAEKAASTLMRMKRCLKDEDIFLLAGQVLNSAERRFQRRVFVILEVSK